MQIEVQAAIAVAVLFILAIWPEIKGLFHVVMFAAFRAQVRHIWKTEIADEDIIQITGERCWWEAYKDGQSPREAIECGAARAE